MGYKMPKAINRLTALAIKNASKPGYLADGGNLYVQTTDRGGKSWAFRYELHGRRRELGLGPCHTITLAEAREKATALRKLLLAGIDPYDERQRNKTAAAIERAKLMTFDQCAAQYIADNRPAWKNAKHAAQWESTLAQYASPVIGSLPVGSIDTGLVLKVVKPLWTAKTETANRVRGRIESILGWATVNGHRTGDNHAQWRNHLDKVLPARNDVAKVKNHSALPWQKIGTFMAELRGQEGAAARAVELAILTACRSGEIRNAGWKEFDLDNALWIIPESRMKAKKEHWVPLSTTAMDLLKTIKATSASDLVFPGIRDGKAMSDMSLTSVIRRMNERAVSAGNPEWRDANGDVITVHGFRSSFRDWAGDSTAFARETVEHALAHQLKDKAEAAYARSTLIEKRRVLMDAWATYCNTLPATKGDNVVGIGAKVAA